MAPSHIDMEFLAEIREDLEEDFPEFVESFCVDADVHIATLQVAIREDDARTLFECGHTLKSSSAYVGAVRLSELFAELEGKGRSGTTTGAAPVLDEATIEFSVVRGELRSILAQT